MISGSQQLGVPVLTLSPSQQPSRIVSNSDEVDIRLHKLNSALTQALFIEANHQASRARIEATIAHAPTAAGTLHWHELVAALRLSLTEKDWQIKNYKNCPLIISADQLTAIVVMTGDSQTGKAFGKDPTNQADKGSVLDAAIQKNYQYQLFENDAISKLSTSGTKLWVFLYHVEKGIKGDKEIRSELSLPSSFQRKKIADWSERIILRSISTNPATPVTPSLPATPINVVVERKTGTSF